eukprot:3298890-Rhodomonas_salina.3
MFSTLLVPHAVSSEKPPSNFWSCLFIFKPHSGRDSSMVPTSPTTANQHKCFSYQFQKDYRRFEFVPAVLVARLQ